MARRKIQRLGGVVVRKSNALCRASWAPEGIWEARLVALVASKLRATDEDFKTYELKLTEIFPDHEGGEAYRLLDKTTDYAMSRVLRIKNEKTGDWDKYNLFSRCRYNHANGTITVCFHPDLKPHYLQLKQRFAQYDLATFLVLPSSYSQRIYEILKSWSDKPEFIYTVEELCKMLEAPPSLQSDFGNFRQRVLVKAHEDIHKHTDLKYDWEPIKTGRKVTAVRFFFNRKIPAALPVDDWQKRTTTSKRNNKLFVAAVACHEKTGGKCARDNQRAVCQVCDSIHAHA